MCYLCDGGGMNLGQVISRLEDHDPYAGVRVGFGAPHSWRGFYEMLAFEPVSHTTVGEMLAHARAAVGGEFTGYKGGEYVMDLETQCHWAPWGGSGVALTDRLLEMMIYNEIP